MTSQVIRFKVNRHDYEKISFCVSREIFFICSFKGAKVAMYNSKYTL